MIRPANPFLFSVVLLLSACPAVWAQSVGFAGGLSDFEQLSSDPLLRPAPNLNLEPPPADPELNAVWPADASTGDEPERSYWTRVLVSGAVGGLAGYVLGGRIDGMGDCVWMDDRRCTNPNADQQGFVVGTSVGILVSGILYFW